MGKVNYNQEFRGIIGQIGIFDIKPSIKNMTVKKPGEHYGKQFNIEKTHTVAFKIAEITDKWITIGHRKFREGDELIFQVEQGSDWVDLYSGSEVFFWYGFENGYPKVDINSLKILTPAGRPDKVYTYGTAKPSGGGTGGGGTFNPKGAIEGNAFNCSMILNKYKAASPKFLETALQIIAINGTLKDEGFDGPAIGMAITNACHATGKIGLVEETARGFLTTQIPAISKGELPNITPKPQEEPPVPIDDSDIPF